MSVKLDYGASHTCNALPCKLVAHYTAALRAWWTCAGYGRRLGCWLRIVPGTLAFFPCKGVRCTRAGNEAMSSQSTPSCVHQLSNS